MIDWNRLITDPVLQSLGALLRQQFGVWVGVVDAFGKTYPAGDEGAEPFSRPVCVRFCSKAVTPARGASATSSPDTSTCAQSNRRWSEQATPALDDIATHCHAGLAAMVIGFDEDGQSAPSSQSNMPPEGRAGLYISGYVHAERAYEKLGRIRALLKANKLAPETEAATDAIMDTIPRLDRR